MRLATTTGGRTVRVEAETLVPLPGRLVDHLCRPPAPASGPPLPAREFAFGPPIGRPGKIVCLGLNYADHARETGSELPSSPLLFAKAPTCIVGPGYPVVTPPGDVRLDHEAELAVVVGRPCRDIEPAQARSFIGGFACFNDISERLAQKDDGQWFRGKSHDTFAPFGPWVVTPDEIDDPHDLEITCTVNDEIRQHSNTANMVFRIDDIVAFCSRAFTLEPGDVIATGTPSGVALATGRWLRPGDVVSVEIAGLGTLTNPIV